MLEEIVDPEEELKRCEQRSGWKYVFPAFHSDQRFGPHAGLNCTQRQIRAHRFGLRQILPITLTEGYKKVYRNTGECVDCGQPFPDNFDKEGILTPDLRLYHTRCWRKIGVRVS